MLIRASFALALALTLSGCRSEIAAMKLGGPGYGAALQAQERYGVDRLPAKTMSDRIVAAMALERVTGRKPDPARFLDSH